MNILKKARNIEQMRQLESYIQSSNGEITGSYSFLEESSEGGEMEVGVRGIYKSDASISAKTPSIIFESTSEDHVMQIVVNEETLAFGAVQVFSRKKI
ncbi:MAG: hypothetical protein NVSMB46_03400 [Candidatus Saccharimonadales bacterium]